MRSLRLARHNIWHTRPSGAWFDVSKDGHFLIAAWRQQTAAAPIENDDQKTYAPVSSCWDIDHLIEEDSVRTLLPAQPHKAIVRARASLFLLAGRFESGRSLVPGMERQPFLPVTILHNFTDRRDGKNAVGRLMQATAGAFIESESYNRAMGAAHPLVVTGAAELQIQLEHPSAEVIHSRAIEVFGNADKAQVWLNRPRKIFNGRSPGQIIESGDLEMMRGVLKALIAIEFGTFS